MLTAFPVLSMKGLLQEGKIFFKNTLMRCPSAHMTSIVKGVEKAVEVVHCGYGERRVLQMLVSELLKASKHLKQFYLFSLFRCFGSKFLLVLCQRYAMVLTLIIL